MSIAALSSNRFIDQPSALASSKDAFENAIRTGDLAAVKELVKQGFILDWPLLNDQYPLHLAIRENQMEIAVFLLESGANPELPDAEKLNALDHAVLSGNQTFLSHIFRIKLGKELKETEEQLQRKSQWREFSALKKSDFLSLKFGGALKNFFGRLNREGLDPIGDLRKKVHQVSVGAGIDPEKMTSLSQQAYRGGLERKETLGPSVLLNWKDLNGYTPLHYAILGNELGSFARLIAAGADPTVLTETGDTLLHFAAIAGSKQMVEKLIDLGLDPNLADEEGNTPVHYAAVEGRLSQLEAFVKKGGRIDLLNRFELPPLCLAGASSSEKDPLKLSSLQTLLFVRASLSWLSQWTIASGWATGGAALAAVNLSFLIEFFSPLIDFSLVPISDPIWRILLVSLQTKHPWMSIPLQCATVYSIGLLALENIKLCFKNRHRKITAFRNLFVNAAIVAHSYQRLVQKCAETLFPAAPNSEAPKTARPVCKPLTKEKIEQLKSLSPQARALDPNLDPNCPAHNLAVIDPLLPDEIKKRWRKLSLELHPDTNRGDPKAEDAMVRANQANDFFK